MSPRRDIVWAVLAREWREVTGNRMLLGMTLLPPVIILVAGILVVWAAALNQPSERAIAALYAASPALEGLEAPEAVQGMIAQYFLILLLMIPTIVPLTIAIYSVIGEKTNRTLEPLLAAPVGVGELLVAKSLAAALPAIAVTYVAYGIYLTAVHQVGSQPAINAVFSPRWVSAMVMLVPLLTLLSVNLGVLISTRVNDLRVAQQIGGLIVVPIVAIGILHVTGRIVLDEGSLLFAGSTLLALDLIVLWMARLSFRREHILVHWR